MKAAKTRANSAKHAGTKKHHGTAKHAPTAAKKTKAGTQHKQKAKVMHLPPKAAKARALPLLAELADCCTAEAIAASLRLTGRPVSDADVWALHQCAGGGYDVPVTIEEALEAACASGVAGIWPVSFAAVDLDDPAALILGVELPGPHAVCADGGQWVSWGAHWPLPAFPDAVIEEAWAITWP